MYTSEVFVDIILIVKDDQNNLNPGYYSDLTAKPINVFGHCSLFNID